MERQSRVLIVDDNPTNVAILEEMLGDEFDINIAGTGEEALEICPEFRPGLILLDIMMPGIDGYETCQRIRENPTLRSTKIIMVSAKAMVAERLKGYEVGADDYVTKPFNEDELLAKVRVYLRLKSVEELDQLKTDLLSLLSHETRNPLNGIIPPLDMIMSDKEMEQEEREMLLNMVYQSAKGLQALFDKILALSAMKSGRFPFSLAEADLGEVVGKAVAAVSSQASERKVEIDQELPDSPIAVLDREQMERVVTGMLDNAIRFSPPEGRVVVSVAREDAQFHLKVADQGQGIDPEILPHLFSEFTDSDVKHHTGGHGLSLAIARQVVMAHDGTIDVQNKNGCGTTFTVRLPVNGPQKSETQSPA